MTDTAVTRKDVESLHGLLCESEAARQALQLLLHQARREAEESVHLHHIELEAMRIARDAALEESGVLRSRLEEALSDRDELLSSVDVLEFEIGSLKRQVDSRIKVPHQRMHSAEVFHRYLGEEDDTMMDVEALHDEYAAMGAAVLGGGPAAGSESGASTREKQLLHLVEQSASVYFALETEIHDMRSEVVRLRSEKQHWQTTEFELHAAIARLENEREQFISREVERTADIIIATHALMTDEARDRKLLEHQAAAALHSLAYQRCRNDAAVISKQLNAKLQLAASEHAREQRRLEAAMRLELDRMAVVAQSAREADAAEHERRCEEMRLARQKLELQNAMLKANCDEWRAQSERKDSEHEDAMQRMRQDAVAQLQARDRLLREAAEGVQTLKTATAGLQRALEACTVERDELKQQIRDGHAAALLQRDRLRTSWTQTDDMESEERMRERLLCELEDEVSFARRVTAHPLFREMEALVDDLRSDCAKSNDACSRALERASAAEVTLAESSRAHALATQKLQDAVTFVTCERDAAVSRCDVLGHQRDVSDRDAKLLLARVDSLQVELAAAVRERASAAAAVATMEAQLSTATASLADANASVARHATQRSALEEALRETAAAVEFYALHARRLERLQLESEEQLAREQLQSNVDLVLSKLAAIGSMLFESNELDDA